ncbi:MAG: thioredoxin family protein [Planctomycetes bacterium]|nr:thioredoxin family protein [Planctomycetota bacterium]
MTGLALATTLGVAIFSTGAQSYREAYEHSQKTGAPLVLLVGAEWCPACKTMQSASMPQVARRGLLSRVAFTYVNVDRQRDLARKVMQGGSIPQLIMYRQTAKGWERTQLTGSQSADSVAQFINRGLATTSTVKSEEGQTVRPVSHPAP